MRIEVSNANKLSQIAREMARYASMNDAHDRALLQGAAVGEMMAKRALTTGFTRAIDTGYLRASTRITEFVSGSYAKITSVADYGIYVHEGTSKMRSRPYMDVASEKMVPELERVALKNGVDILNKVIGGVLSL